MNFNFPNKLKSWKKLSRKESKSFDLGRLSKKSSSLLTNLSDNNICQFSFENSETIQEIKVTNKKEVINVSIKNDYESCVIECLKKIKDFIPFFKSSLSETKNHRS